MVKRVLRGAFINTEPALCSIYESGRQVFDCISAPEIYDLDYFDLSDIDIEALRLNGVFRLKPDAKAANQPAASYDFWVLNHHHMTMVPHFPVDLVEKLVGLTFAIVLEVEPQNPLAMAARSGFDGFVVLDPSADATGKVFPFPRPLITAVERPAKTGNPIPVIGSFGMGTPGKGFELVVEAVNREFDEAVVRINVPSSTYADSGMHGVHNEPYALHLKRLCEFIAKPGVKIEFTQKFMEDEELLKWCGSNDLNLFLYSRRQSGLSATTDQAVASGRPLLVSSNDTFRHIHPYIKPYPITSLREAIKSGAPAVERMQKAWSREAFRRRFLGMLADYGVINDHGLPESYRLVLTAEVERKRLLFGYDPQARGRSTDQKTYDVRVADAMSRTGAFDVASMPFESGEDLSAAIIWHAPDVVLQSERAVLLHAASPSKDSPADTDLFISIGSAQASLACETRNEKALVFLRRPLVPYFTSVVAPAEGPPQFCLVGFSSDTSNLEAVLSKLQRELGGGVVNLLCGDAQRRSLERRIAAFRHQLFYTPGLDIRLVSVPGSAVECVHLFASQRILIFSSDADAEEDLLSLAELALTTERAVVFTAASRFAAFAGYEPLLEDQWLPDLLIYASAVQVGLVSEFGEGRFVEVFSDFLNVALAGRSARTERALPWCKSGKTPLPNGVVTDENALWYTMAAGMDPSQHALEASYIAAQQGFLDLALKWLVPSIPGAKILVFGNPERSGATRLADAGYDLVLRGASGVTGTADGVVGTVTLSGVNDAKAVLEEAVAALRDGGGGAFTFFYRDVFAAGDTRENPDFPVLTQDDIGEIIASLPVELIGPAAWRSSRPEFVPQPFSPPPLGTLMFRKSQTRKTRQRK